MGQGHLAVCGPDARRQVHRRAFGGLGHQRGQPRAQPGEDGLEVGRPRAGLELVEQGVVGLVAHPDGLGLASLELHHAREWAGVGREVVRRPRVHPGADAPGARLADLAHQRLGHREGAVALPDGEPQHAPLVVVEVVPLRERRQGLAGVLADDLAVAQGGEGPELARAPLGPARRHQGLAVPPHEGAHAGEIGQRAHPVEDQFPLG